MHAGRSCNFYPSTGGANPGGPCSGWAGRADRASSAERDGGSGSTSAGPALMSGIEGVGWGQPPLSRVDLVSTHPTPSTPSLYIHKLSFLL